MNKKRVTYIVSHFPQISETYIRSELEAIEKDYDIQIISTGTVDTPYRNHLPFQEIFDPLLIQEAIEEFCPDILHTHWLVNTRDLAYFAGYFNPTWRQIPFSIRAHSFDTLAPNGKYIQESAPLINSELCLGVLTFPFTRSLLEKAGIHREKIYDCYPVVNFRRFYDRTPNGNGVMNVTSALPKKKLPDFLELASQIPGKPFNLYCYGGYLTREIERLNQEMGNPVNLIPAIEPEEMPKEYKKHEWLVYTGSREANLVGWPMAVAEAQSAGVGVCFPNLRPDLKEYLGGAGFLYDSISEVAEIISKPYPEEMREKGFEQARKSDIFQHKKILTDLWEKGTSDRTASTILVGQKDSTVTPWGEAETVLERRYQLLQSIHELEQIIPAGSTVAVADDPYCLGVDNEVFFSQYSVIPFLERDGHYWGTPADDKSALEELERMRHSSANYLIFCWYSFWWFDCYREFYKYLRSQFNCVLKNNQLVVFALKS